MSANDRFETIAETESVTRELSDEPVYVMVYPEIKFIPYSVRQLVPAFYDVTAEEMESMITHEESWDMDYIDTEYQGNHTTLVVNMDKDGFGYTGFDGASKYSSIIRQFENAGEASFFSLAQRYPQKELELLSSEEAVAICETAVRKMNLQLELEEIIACDAGSLNELQENPNTIDTYKGFGSTAKEIKKWTREQEFYALFYRPANQEGFSIHSLYFSVDYIVLICRVDRIIVYVDGACPLFDLSIGEGKETKAISEKQAWEYALRYAGKHKISSVTLGYCMEGGTADSRFLAPCWVVAYESDINGRIVTDRFYLDATTGAKINQLQYY